jgi:hypothetical protein
VLGEVARGTLLHSFKNSRKCNLCTIEDGEKESYDEIMAVIILKVSVACFMFRH